MFDCPLWRAHTQIARISRPKLFVCNSLQPLRHSQKSYLRQNQQFAASFAKHPGWGALRARAIALTACALFIVLTGSACAKRPAEESLAQRLVAKDASSRVKAVTEAKALPPEARRTLTGSLVPLLRAGDADTRLNAVDAATKVGLSGEELRAAVIDALNRVGTEDALATAFLYRIAGRWNFAYVRKGKARWWPDHGMAAPRNQTHYIFRPTELVMESRPEFNPPSITDRFVYGSVRGVSADLFDVKLQKQDDPSGGEIKRFKLSANGKTLELAVDAERNAEPTVQVLELVDANWTDVKQ